MSADQLEGLRAKCAELRERAEAAEGDAVHLAKLINEFSNEDFVFLDEETQEIATRVLSGAGVVHEWRSTSGADDIEIGGAS